MDHPQFEVGEKDRATGLEPGQVYYVEPPPQGRGCLFYGCLFAGIIGMLGVLAVGGIAFMGYRMYSQMVDEYTATAPIEMPKVEATEEQIKDVETRWATFKEAYDKGESAEIVLSQEDLNILASREPDFKDHVYFTLDGDKANVKLSFDLTESKLPRTKGRFFNATGTVTAEVTPSGRVDIRLRDIEVGGKPLPKEFAEGIGAENLADEMLKNRKNREFRDKIDRIEIKDSKVYLKIRATEAQKAEKKSESDEPAKEAPAAEPPAKAEPAKPAEEPAKPAEEPAKAADEANKKAA